MNRFFCLIVFVFFLSSSFDTNPFFKEFDTPFGAPPFEQIQVNHYKPAFIEGMNQNQKEIEAIINNPEAPTFENTIVALDLAGELLTRVNNIFNNMLSANTSDELQAIAKEVAPLLSKHNDDILLNDKLFQRVKKVYEKKDQLNLTREQLKVLEEYYKDFVKGGANLPDAKKAELREINTELSVLTLKFGDNVLKEDNKFVLVIDNKADLTGLSADAITAAAETATERGYAGKWVFTLHKPSLIPFLQYSERRDLREKMFKAYINRGNNNDEFDNKETLAKIVNLRIKRSKLLGYQTFAHFVLEDNMAKVPENVYTLLNKLWIPAIQVAKKEASEFQQMINHEGGNFILQPWDWWYYAEKVKKAKYDLDDEALRPYFKLENVIDGAFAVANKLWGITFTERTDLPKYHEDVKVFEVREVDGTHVGILYTDYFPRSSKRGGAWMSNYRSQYRLNGKEIRPIITNVGNFAKPTAEKPSLLNFDEVKTMFHEFGHGLHGLLSKCTYPKLSGTSVPRDFVELPSQVMENWASEREVLKMYAKHYQTGEPIPDELIAKIENSSKFNQGFETVEYLAASFLDLDWHTLENESALDVLTFENESLNKIGLIPEIVVRYRSP
ncbi:M3 family metallopeptidase, partial [candidate division KSB1 bacterium]|nr:M3 family metallopeptidase [candidate division KSB1 bacterium]